MLRQVAMTEHVMSDKALCCASCGDTFVFSSGEQELYRLRGVTAEPEQCPTCVRGRLLVGQQRRVD